MAYHLLTDPIKRYIRKKGWEELRPIQNAAIHRILASDHHYILSSRTASGKTEAAFLPILSKVDFNQSGVQVLYISPLIALINDQFHRIEDLCKDLEVPVTKWHGEAKRSLKNKLLKEPAGIVLITPESIEAMFANKSFMVKQLFSSLQYVVIDEIHSFVGTDRGLQLQSLLSRLQQINVASFSIVGLSATMSEVNKFAEVKAFTGEVERTKILIDRKAKDINAVFRYFPTETKELPLDLLKDLYRNTCAHKVLIFPNSRGRTEEVAVKLKKISARVKGHPHYFSHHSSVDREVREYVEYFAKNNKRQSFCIACTSTLELGIDIGTVDKVVQIDATHSIASLIQRVGRSGRQDDSQSNLYLYATKPWSLLQSIACWLLYQEGFIEPPKMNPKPYDILLHQILSIVKGYAGLQRAQLMEQLQKNAAFQQITPVEIDTIVDHLLATDLLEAIREELIIGVEGEYLVNSRNFYSVFQTEENYSVVNNKTGNSIGQLPFSPMIMEDVNILLSAKVWKILQIDHTAKKINVIPAHDGKKPLFFGGGADIHPKVREKMLAILCSRTSYDFLDQASQEVLHTIREEFTVFKSVDSTIDRLLLSREKSLYFFSFTGTRINRTLHLLLQKSGIESTLDDSQSMFSLQSTREQFLEKWPTLLAPLPTIEQHLAPLLAETPTLLSFSKWGLYLPEVFQIKLLQNSYYDFEGAKQFLTSTKVLHNE